MRFLNSATVLNTYKGTNARKRNSFVLQRVKRVLLIYGTDQEHFKIENLVKSRRCLVATLLSFPTSSESCEYMGAVLIMLSYRIPNTLSRQSSQPDYCSHHVAPDMWIALSSLYNNIPWVAQSVPYTFWGLNCDYCNSYRVQCKKCAI